MNMTETPQSSPSRTVPGRLNQTLMWVGIVAGVVFVVAVVFFSGLVIGWSSGGASRDSWQHGPGMMGYNNGCNGPGGMMWPGQSPSATPRP